MLAIAQKLAKDLDKVCAQTLGLSMATTLPVSLPSSSSALWWILNFPQETRIKLISTPEQPNDLLTSWHSDSPFVKSGIEGGTRWPPQSPSSSKQTLRKLWINMYALKIKKDLISSPDVLKTTWPYTVLFLTCSHFICRPLTVKMQIVSITHMY